MADGQGWTNVFNKYVWNENLGWIRLDVRAVGPLVRGYAESENFGWICFSSGCGANITRNPTTGKLTGYAVSEMFGWIDVSQAYLKPDDTTSGYAQSENIGWIGF